MSDDTTIQINLYSLCSYYVEIFFNDQKLSNATCFFTKRDSKQYLITNWHVVSGRNADTKVCLDKNAAIPNNLRVYLPAISDDGSFLFGDYIKIDLYDGEGNQKWYEMQNNDKMIDIAVLPITQDLDGCILNIEDAEEPFNESVFIEIANDVYVLGYPFGPIGGVFPIWKKASIASEPNIDIQQMPYFFIDTATRSGMSGSPVVIYRKRSIAIEEKSTGKSSGHITKLIGVYSGRIGADSDMISDAQLGRVWKVSVIDKIIELNQ